MALAPGFRTDFRESLYRMIAALTRLGVTIVSTVEIEENFTSMDLSNFTVSFLADDIVPPALRLDQWPTPQDAPGGEDAPQPAQHRHVRIPDHLQGAGHRRSRLRGYRALTSGIPSPWSFESEKFRIGAPRLKEMIPMSSTPITGDSTPKQTDFQRQLREMNEALLVSSVRQHELAEQAQQAEALAARRNSHWLNPLPTLTTSLRLCENRSWFLTRPTR